MPNSGKPVDKLKGYSDTMKKMPKITGSASGATPKPSSSIAKSNAGSGGYLGNVKKEAGQYSAAWKKASNAKLPIDIGNSLQKKAQKELGQLAGAVLQGRRYDAKGKQIKK
mgnify:CR=1 FL=1